MATSAPRDHDTTERVERYERERIVERPAYTAPAASNVNVGPTTATVARDDAVWTVTRVVTLLFTVLEVLLLLRFVLKLFGANQNQPLVSGLYGVTEPLVRPFQGIFPEPSGPLDLAALLAVAFFFLIAALIVALVRAITTNRTV
jgi:uncharacterized protein YggT (Ycf19 family)